ncbi:MAG: hypothetical protein RIE32_04855 [Phycisphaerales bacterium]
MPLNPARLTNRTPTSLAIAALLVAACPSLALQQDSDDAPLLAGPSVGGQAEPLTLVRHDFTGAFQRLDRHPAEAALALIRENFTVEPSADGAIASILADRRRLLDDLVVERLDVLIKLANGGDERDRVEAIGVLRRAMAPEARKGALGDRIRAHLPGPAAAEHARLEREYLDAAIADRVQLLEAERAGMGQGALRLRARAIETLVGLGAEVRSAYERTIVQKGEQLDELIAALNLSPEQEGTVRRLVQAYGEETLLDKDAREDQKGRLALFLQIAAELTPDQRRALIAHARGEG